jgi:hypothetical protein
MKNEIDEEEEIILRATQAARKAFADSMHKDNQEGGYYRLKIEVKFLAELDDDDKKITFEATA